LLRLNALILRPFHGACQIKVEISPGKKQFKQRVLLDNNKNGPRRYAGEESNNRAGTGLSLAL
jgi:hypothetical protein